MTRDDIQALLKPLRPDRQLLVDVLRARVDDSMAVEIAMADYGYGFKLNLKALNRIRATGHMPNPLEWEPREVLELIRWSRPEDPSWKPGATGERGHLMRAFACCVLLNAEFGLSASDGSHQTLAKLLDSTAGMDGAVKEAAASFVASLFELKLANSDEESPFYALGVLVAGLQVDGFRSDTGRVLSLVACVEKEEARVRNDQLCEGGLAFLLGLSLFDLSHYEWRELTRRFLIEQESAPAEGSGDALKRLGERILNGQ